MNAAGKSGKTAIYWASFEDNPEIVRILADAGADVGAALRRTVGICGPRASGRSLFGIGLIPFGNRDAHMGNPGSVMALVKVGGDVNQRFSHRLNPNTLLYHAAGNCSPEIVRILVNAGADVTATNPSGKTALDRAVERDDQQVVDILKAAGATQTPTPTPQGTPSPTSTPKPAPTPMPTSTPQGTPAPTSTPTPTPTPEPCQGMTLEGAIKGNRIEIVRCLVDAGADVSATDSDGNPILYGAIRSQFVDIVRDLVNAGADVNARTADGDPLLTVAKKTRNEEIIEILEDVGAAE